MKDGERVYIKRKKLYYRYIKYPFCSCCWFFGKCDGTIECEANDGEHQYILTQTPDEKITYSFINPLLRL